MMSHWKPRAHSGSVVSMSNRANQQLAGFRVSDGVEDRVVREQWVSREVHLRDEPLREGAAEDGEVDVRRPPGVRVVLPRIGAGLHRHEAVAALVVGECPPRAGEVRIERGRVLVDLVEVATGGVGLPDLHQRVPHRTAVVVEHAPGDDDSLAERLAGVPGREIRIAGSDGVLAEDGCGEPMDLLRHRH
jgi:hypothetical protein